MVKVTGSLRARRLQGQSIVVASASNADNRLVIGSNGISQQASTNAPPKAYKVEIPHLETTYATRNETGSGTIFPDVGNC